MKVTQKCAARGEKMLFVCDFSPLKSSAAAQQVTIYAGLCVFLLQVDRQINIICGAKNRKAAG